MKKKIPVFWGCTLSDRLPFLERTTRLVLDALDFEPVSPDGLTCCPDPVYGRALEEEEWLVLAARNLALLRQAGDEILVPCNGCLATFVKATNQLKDKAVRDKVNQRLERVGLCYERSPRLTHLLPFFDKIGAETLENKFLYSLEGLRLGVHYGCHVLNTPSAAIDNPEDPDLFERLLYVTGLEVADYEDKLLCCGGSSFSFDVQGSLGLLRQKFIAARKENIDALVLCCPLCFVQFDMQARKLEKDETLPVFYLTELYALALGIPQEELNFDWHVNKPRTLLEEKLEKKLKKEVIISQFDIKRLAECCGACTYECSAARGFQDDDLKRFDPVAIVNKVVEGKIEEALGDPDIWRCLKCHECTKKCPFGDGLPEFFEKLQNLAIKTGIQAKPVEQKVDLIRSKGAGIPPNPAMRKEFNLPLAKGIAADELGKLLE